MTTMRSQNVHFVSRPRENTFCNLHTNMVERQRWIRTQISSLMMVGCDNMRSVTMYKVLLSPVKFK